MKKRFYLVRHGEKVKTAGDPPLSEKGLSQAEETGKFLKNYPITKIVSSPLLRATLTAKKISQILNLNFSTDPLLSERANWGQDSNQSFEDFVKMWQKATIDRHWQPPVGDSSFNAGERLKKVIASSVDDEQIILVTHGGIITDFLRNTFSEEQLNTKCADFTQDLDNNITEGSITIVDFDSDVGNFDLIQLGSRDHLSTH